MINNNNNIIIKELTLNNILKTHKECVEYNLNIQKLEGYLVLGHLTAQVLFRHIIFMYITQESHNISKVYRATLLNHIIYKLISTHFDEINLWSRNDIGIVTKTQICYRIIGYLHEQKGYDYIFNLLKNDCLNHLLESAEFPIYDYGYIIDRYFKNILNDQITYDVNEIKVFDEYDRLYSATIHYNNEVVEEFGVNKKEAVRNVGKIFAKKFIPAETIFELGECISIKPCILNLEFDDKLIDYSSENRRLQELLGINNPLLWFCLLSRLEIGKIKKHIVTNLKLPQVKKSLIEFGKYILSLFIFKYNFYNKNFENADLSLYDMSFTNNIGSWEVYSKLYEFLNVEKFAEKIYLELFLEDNINNQQWNDNSIHQVPYCLVTAFFIENFEADNKFNKIFDRLLSGFYSENYINSISDYELAVKKFANQLGLKINFDNKNLNNECWEVTIYFDKIKFIDAQIENTVKIAKEVLWEKIYVQKIIPIKDFFSGQENNCDIDFLRFTINCMSKVSDNLLYELKQEYPLLNYKYARKIGFKEYCKSFFNVLKNLKENTLKRKFVTRLENINNNTYIIINNNIYNASQIIHYIDQYSNYHKEFLYEIFISTINEDDKININELKNYDNIINPTAELTKQFIKLDYRNIKNLDNGNEDIIKYAINLNIDAYNYISNPSDTIKKYYLEQKRNIEKALDINNIGQLIVENRDDIKICILDSNKNVSEQIIKMWNGKKMCKVSIGCGYAFSSGMSMIKDILEKPLYESQISVQLLIGSLQKYFNCIVSQDSKITGIDKRTVQLLQRYLLNDNFELFTCENRFYHGKIFMIHGEERTLICMGSSNISHSAFISNYELNIAFDVSNKSNSYHSFCKWFNQLLQYSVKINSIDSTIFTDYEFNIDGSNTINTITISSVQKRIEQLSNEEVKYRLNLWIGNNPDIIVDDLGVFALPEYIAFVYYDKNLLVLESFKAGNAYYCINYKNSFEEEIVKISTLSKTEIFQYSKMNKRGYHIANRFSLENNIQEFFGN